jgi:O-antigen ligase
MVSLIALIALWSNMSPVQQERYLSLTGDEDVRGAETYQSRLSGWTKSITVIAPNPVFGHGIGTSKEAMANEIQAGHVSHILYMEILIELGFIGFIIYMAFIKSIYDALKQTITNIQDIQSFVAENDQYNLGIDLNYYSNMVTALNASFWMYLVFSLAQYGVTEYHWYLLAGLVVLVERNLSVEMEKTSEYIELCAGQSNVPTEVATQTRTHKLKYPERDKRVKK